MPKFPYQLTNHALLRIRQRGIRLRWIQQTLKHPDHVEPDRDDPNVRLAFKRIHAAGNRVLCVAYNFTVHPWRVVTVFFDD